jgi:hypothetical protein
MATRPESFAAMLRVHLAEQSWPGFAWREVAAMLSRRRDTVDSAPWLPYAEKAHRERGL